MKLKKLLIYTVSGLYSFVEYINIKKTRGEINNLIKAAAIADEIFNSIQQEVKPGKKEIEIAELFEQYTKKSKAKKLSFDVIVASGKNAAFPHAVPGEKIIEKNDIVVIDFGVKYKGYCSDMTRTLLMNPEDKKARSLYSLVYRVQQEVLKDVKAGADIKGLDEKARKLFAEHGLKEYFVHGLGHGLGIKVHEKPFINQRAKGKLKSNMVITIEPGIYLPGYGGVRIEDTVIVQKDGYKVITNTPKEKY